MSGAILILSGPSGAGKSTIIREASNRIGAYYFSISSTTRAPREGERDGVEYHFVTREAFEAGIEAGEFLEYAEVHGNYYGTSLKPVYQALEEGKLVIFDIDVQGHRLARNRMDDRITSAFITPPSLSELERRLRARSTDSDAVIDQRLHNAKEEIQAIHEFDYVICSHVLEHISENEVEFYKTNKVVVIDKSREISKKIIDLLDKLGEKNGCD
jgi:guanylate kinase